QIFQCLFVGDSALPESHLGLVVGTESRMGFELLENLRGVVQDDEAGLVHVQRLLCPYRREDMPRYDAGRDWIVPHANELLVPEEELLEFLFVFGVVRESDQEARTGAVAYEALAQFHWAAFSSSLMAWACK